jgi:type IV fimbrial biogenesis protein FimT
LLISNNVTETTNQLITDLNVARAEAVRRGTQVAVISNAGGWSTGWYVVADGDFDGAFDGPPPLASTSKDVLLDTKPARNTGYTVSASATGAGTNDKIIFNQLGNIATPNETFFDINVCRSDSNPARSKRITLQASGSVSSKVGTAGSPATGC